MTLKRFQFLVGSDEYEADVPDEFATAPVELKTAVVLGQAWRMVVYQSDQANSPEGLAYYSHVVDRQTPTGVPASILELQDLPPVRLLVWRTKTGTLVTAFNPEHHGEIDQYVAGVRVNDDDRPTIEYDAPFKGGDARLLNQRDTITWRSGQGLDEQVLKLGRLPRGRRAEKPAPATPPFVEHTAAGEGDIKVSLLAPSARAETSKVAVERIARSIRSVP